MSIGVLILKETAHRPTVYTGVIEATSLPAAEWRPPPARTIRLRPRYCDLDLILMDAITARDAYPDRQNEVRWFEPFLTTHMNYHAGITVALSSFDQIYLGFYTDHRKLAVQRTGGPLSPIADLGDRRDLFRETVLRAVRVGRRLFFEAAEPEIGDLINQPHSVTNEPFAGLIPRQFTNVAGLGYYLRHGVLFWWKLTTPRLACLTPTETDLFL
jgi:hypothetical protein